MGDRSSEFVIIGAGIVGLTLARELLLRGHRSVTVLEKEQTVGVHASGRNSGVLHAGLYYPPGSLKAQLCRQGAMLLHEYAEEHRIPFEKCGKVIVCNSEEKLGSLAVIRERAIQNGVPVEKLTEDELRRFEPQARTVAEALWSPETAIIDPRAALDNLVDEVRRRGGLVKFGQKVLRIDSEKRELSLALGAKLFYGHLINAAGAFADRLAHSMGVGLDYRLMPFEGMYRALRPEFSAKMKHLIYPVPDLAFPFLGVHFTKRIDGTVLVGPNALPILRREYSSSSAKEWGSFLLPLGRAFCTEPRFRSFAFRELRNESLSGFLREAKQLVPGLQKKDFLPGIAKRGIRPQLIKKGRLDFENDFLVLNGPNSTHVLNAISPAFTASFAFARHIVNQMESAAR